MMPPRRGSVDAIVSVQMQVSRLRPCLETLRAELPTSATITVADIVRSEVPEAEKVHEEIALVARSMGLPVSRSPNNSVWQGRNLAAERGVAPLLLFLDGDCVLAKGAWEPALAAMEQENLGALGGMVLWAEGAGAQGGKAGTIKHAGYVFGCRLLPYSRLQGWAPDNPKVYRRDDLQAVSAGCMLTRRSTWRVLRGFDPDRRYGGLCFADADYCLRLRSHGLTVGFEPRFLAVGSTEPLSLSVQELKQGAATLNALAGHLARFDEFAVL